MGMLLEKMEIFRRWLKRYISPAFISLFCASFILWYILKLGNVYTTDYEVLINVDGNSIQVPCVVEGVGTNLFAYRVYMHKELKIPLTDLKYHIEEVLDEQSGEVLDKFYIIDESSMQSAISVRFSDIKVISIGDIPPLPILDDSSN